VLFSLCLSAALILLPHPEEVRRAKEDLYPILKTMVFGDWYSFELFRSKLPNRRLQEIHLWALVDLMKAPPEHMRALQWAQLRFLSFPMLKESAFRLDVSSELHSRIIEEVNHYFVDEARQDLMYGMPLSEIFKWSQFQAKADFRKCFQVQNCENSPTCRALLKRLKTHQAIVPSDAAWNPLFD
jgi:hypothetical protein